MLVTVLSGKPASVSHTCTRKSSRSAPPARAPRIHVSNSNPMNLLDDEIKKMVLKTSDANQINELAVKQGMITLQKDGIEKMLSGITTIEEVLRVTRSLQRMDDIVVEV